MFQGIQTINNSRKVSLANICLWYRPDEFDHKQKIYLIFYELKTIKINIFIMKIFPSFLPASKNLQQCGQHTKDIVDGYNLNSWPNPPRMSKPNYEVSKCLSRMFLLLSLFWFSALRRRNCFLLVELFTLFGV